MATALHVTSCQDEFRQQQIAVLWRASGATHTQVNPPSHPQPHPTAPCTVLCSYFYLFLCFAETFGVWAREDSWFSPHRCTVPAVRPFFMSSIGSLLSFLTVSVSVFRFSIFPLPSGSTCLSQPLFLTCPAQLSTRQMLIITEVIVIAL